MLMKMKPTVVLGTFDGVHPGHRALLTAAKELGAPVLVYTFARAPKGAPLLTLPEDRKALLCACGADDVIFEDFASVKELSPEAFVRDVLVGRLGAGQAVCGFDYRFGRMAAGDPAMLRELMARQRGTVRTVSEVDYAGCAISSTKIRALLEEGEAAEAASWLGRPFFYHLPVAWGKQIGRTIGIPTANMRIPSDMVRMARGVYATVGEVEGKRYAAVSSIGYRPTVNADVNDITCETHLMGFAGDLYEKRLKIHFLARMREERRFDGLDALKAQIALDMEQARATVKGAGICVD